MSLNDVKLYSVLSQWEATYERASDQFFEIDENWEEIMNPWFQVSWTFYPEGDKDGRLKDLFSSPLNNIV